CLIAGRPEDAARHLAAYVGSTGDDWLLVDAAFVAPEAVLPMLAARVPSIEAAERLSDLEAYACALLGAGRREEAFRAFSRALELPGGRYAGTLEGLVEADPERGIALAEPMLDRPDL